MIAQHKAPASEWYSKYSEFVLKEWQRRGFLIDRMSSERSGAALRLKLYKSLILNILRTACPRLEVFTFCWALLSFSFSCLPFSTSPNRPSLALWRRTIHWKERGTWPQTRAERENTVARSLTECMCRTKEVTWPADWIWGMNRAMIDQDHTWWREREGVCLSCSSHMTSDGRVGVQPGGQGQHVPNKHGEKTINRTFAAGEKYGGSRGGLLRRKI